jgi:hypothetical protein
LKALAICAIAGGDVLQRIAHHDQAAQLAADEHRHQRPCGQHAQRGDGGGGAHQRAQGSGGLGLVGRDGQDPRRAFDLGGIDHLHGAVDLHLGMAALRGQAGDQRGVEAGRQVGHGLERQLRPRVREDGGVRAVEQHGEALVRGVDAVDLLDHRLQQHVGPDHGGDLPALEHRLDEAHRELARGRVGIDRRDGRPARRHGLLVPGARRAVVARRARRGEDVALVGQHEEGLVQTGLLGCLQEGQGLGLRHRQLEGAGQALLVAGPLRQLLRIQAREAAHAVVQRREGVAAHGQESHGRQGDEGERGNGDAGADQPCAQGVEHGRSFGKWSMDCDPEARPAYPWRIL